MHLTDSTYCKAMLHSSIEGSDIHGSEHMHLRPYVREQHTICIVLLASVEFGSGVVNVDDGVSGAVDLRQTWN